MRPNLASGDSVVVIHLPWIRASAHHEGRHGLVLALDLSRAIAGVRLDNGIIHAMPMSCLRRVDAIVH